MNTLDIILVIILAVGAYSGFKKGLIMEIAGFLAFIIAIIAGFLLLDWGMGILSRYVRDLGSLLPFVAFLIIFIMILIGIILLGKFLKTALHLTPLGIADSLAGAFLGILKWAFGLSLLIWLVSTVGMDTTGEVVSGSQIFPWLVPIAPFVFSTIAEWLPFLGNLFDSIRLLFEET